MLTCSSMPPDKYKAIDPSFSLPYACSVHYTIFEDTIFIIFSTTLSRSYPKISGYSLDSLMSNYHNPNHAFPQPSSTTGFGAQPAHSLMPPPELTSPDVSSPTIRRTSSSHQPRQAKLNQRNKTKPSIGDPVLIMSLNPDSTGDASAYALDSESDFSDTGGKEPMPVPHQLLDLKRTEISDQLKRPIGQSLQVSNQNDAVRPVYTRHLRELADYNLEERERRELEVESDRQFIDRRWVFSRHTSSIVEFDNYII